MKNSKLFVSAVAATAALACALAPATASAEATTTTVWEETSGNGDLGSSWGKLIEIPGKNFKNAMAGDVVKFTFAEQGENPQIQIAAQAGPG